MTAKQILDTYIAFFEQHGHTRILNAPLVPLNDPTTLFNSSGMQPLVPYLLGEKHPSGTRLVNAQNCFRAVDIEEIGDNRHTTFFRMLGNWSLGDYFKKEQLQWVFQLITKHFNIPANRLYVTVFEGTSSVPKDEEAVALWTEIFEKEKLNPKERIFFYDAKKNWWSRSGTPDKMPPGEPGGPDTEIFYDFGAELQLHGNSEWRDIPCHVNCDCGRYIEICNSVFMQYKKEADGTLAQLSKPNVDFGGGLERFLLASNNQPDVFQTTLLAPIIKTIARITGKTYQENKTAMRIITDHFIASCFITLAGVKPSNTEQGYILRRLIRRGLDNLMMLQGHDVKPVIESIIEQYKDTDPELTDRFETILGTIQDEAQKYTAALSKAKAFIQKKYAANIVIPANKENYKLQSKISGDDLYGSREISPEDAFIVYSTHGLSPTQIESLGFTFDKQAFADFMEKHQKLSRSGAGQKFSGGLADHQQRTIMGHTATHLLQQALRDVLGNHVHQTGSNITTERLRFDFSHTDKLSDDEINRAEELVNKKIKDNLPVHFEMLPLAKAKTTGAIGLFDEKYEQKVKVYFIGGSGKEGDHHAYSKEFCGGPHVEFTGEIKSFKIIKQENIGNKQRRIYAVVGN